MDSVHRKGTNGLVLHMTQTLVQLLAIAPAAVLLRKSQLFASLILGPQLWVEKLS